MNKPGAVTPCRLIEDQKFRLNHQGIRQRQLLLALVAERRTPDVTQRIEFGKQRKYGFRYLDLRFPGGTQRNLQILFHRKPGENAPVLRDIADAQGCPRVGVSVL